MMRVPSQFVYSVCALVELARHGAWKGAARGPVPLRMIVKIQGIPEPFLRQIFHTLKRRHLVNAVMGKHGGYQLAREPARITIGDVANVFGWKGRSDSLPCYPGDRALFRGNPFTPFWSRMTGLLQHEMNNTTIASLQEDTSSQRHLASPRHARAK